MSEQFTVIFDFDGTLADTLGLMVRLYNDTCPQYGTLPVDESEFDELRKLGYKKAMKSKKIRLTQLPRLALQISREMKNHMGEVSPHPGVIQLLRNLQEQDISIGVLTSNNAALVQDFFDANDFPQFDFVVSEKTVFGKEKALRRIMKRHKLPKEKIIYVGDEPRDIISSRKAGIKVFGVTWGLGGEQGLKDTPPDRLVSDSKELYRCILEARQ
jgi:phosphoglycolate phosphatase